MISPEFSTLVTLVFYALASIVGIAGIMARSAFWRRLACFLALCGFVCQTVLLMLGFHKALPGGLSLGAYLQLLAWFLLLCGIVVWGKLHQETLLLFSAPLGLLLFVMSAPYLGTLVTVPASLHTPFYVLHIGALFSSLALLALASVAGVLFLLLEKRIKRKQRMENFFLDMPAITLLDKINALGTLLSFPLYTLGIVTGLLWAKSIFGDTGDPKEVVSVVIWLIFAVLFYSRLLKGMRGRKAALLTALIFTLCLFSIFVVNTVMDTHHTFFRLSSGR
ncbi:MAG: cytochrome c assembly protein [Candidatus Desulfovibrio kirbyi]|uniref:Cytochrome c assembly protein n=1 Tax=Candidatus Desulfovibrio kirbyi TaxID=2696086 RepID=A0A6L2R4X8_9BACT|nr:MAG: cytochrome c assembly protein [Candidatus Desulfovibrio kirbyi]